MYWNNATLTTGCSWSVININMRCIEIGLQYSSKYQEAEININMRCIEIYTVLDSQAFFYWLTLTWDVLKWCS